MKKVKIDEGPIQAIFALLLIIGLGVLSGWYFDIEITLVASAVSIIFLAAYIWDVNHGGGSGGSGELGVIFIFIIPLMIFTAVLLVSGLICHWSDLLYILREIFRQ